jgi:CheY-like chemotaxis protein
LTRAGCSVAEARDGREALRQLERAVPALILLDLIMPELDGFEVLEALRRNEAWHDVPVIIITAKDLSRDELARLNGRAERVFQKGAYDRAELTAIVHGMIAGRVLPAASE